MNDNLWKKPKDVGGELQWRNGWSWRDVYFQVSADTIHLYPMSRKAGNGVCHSISLTQVDEISEMGTKFSSRSFKIILKMGTIEQFKCPAKKDGLKVQQWIDSLRHSKKFWSDKENLQQRKPEPQKKVTLERQNEPSKSPDDKKVQIFFTLWNGETIGLLVSMRSTFTDVYPRLFSFACETSSCSICKIRHQSCDLWFVDATGSARRVSKDENLTDLDKSGQCFVMEHHQKLLVVFFSDSSYKSLLVPGGITAHQVLKLDQIASKLNRLSCFDPGLFLRRYEDGKEVQFCMNDIPFQYQEHGKIVARSKRIQRNSLKKSNYEIIAEIRWKEYQKYIHSQRTKDAAEDQLASQIRKSSRVDDELCFFDDHFAVNNDETRSNKLQRTSPLRYGTKRPPKNSDNDFDSKDSNGDNGSSADHLTPGNLGDHSSTCLEPNVAQKLSPDLVSATGNDNVSTKLPDNDNAKNNADVIDTDEVRMPYQNWSDDEINGEGSSADESLRTNNEDASIHLEDHENTPSVPVNDHPIVSGPSQDKPCNSSHINLDSSTSTNNDDVSSTKDDVTKQDVTDTKHGLTNTSRNSTNTSRNSTNTSRNSTNTSRNSTNAKHDVIDTNPRNLTHSISEGLVFQEQRKHHLPVRHLGMRRSLSDLNIRYSSTSIKTRDAEAASRGIRASSVSCINEDEDEVVQVKCLYRPTPEISDHSDDDCPANPLSTFTGPTGTFAKRVQDCVTKILTAKTDAQAVDKLISEDLSKILYELLDHGLKKNFLGISLLSAGTNVWSICQTVCKATKVGVKVMKRINDGSIEHKFKFFIHECIRKKILSRWFEELSSESIQKQIMKYYEPSAVVLEPEHSEAMEQIKLYLDGLDVLKLERWRVRELSKGVNEVYIYE